MIGFGGLGSRANKFGEFRGFLNEGRGSREVQFIHFFSLPEAFYPTIMLQKTVTLVASRTEVHKRKKCGYHLAHFR